MPTIEQGRPQASRGFTLIEMSIVLVIIGLIVGGILKGQEIVNSSREKAVINQINAVRSAQSTYFDRHNALPGDDKKGTYIAAVIKNGDGDGYVGSTSATLATLITNIQTNSKTNATEEFNYFVGLLAEGLIGNATLQTTAAAVTGFGVDNNSVLPNVAFPSSGLGVGHGPHPGDTTANKQSAVADSNWLGIWSFTSANNGGTTLRQAIHIDTLMDDGLPDQGLVRGDDVACNQPKSTGYGGSGATAAGGATSDPVCTLLINMGGS